MRTDVMRGGKEKARQTLSYLWLGYVPDLPERGFTSERALRLMVDVWDSNKA